MASRGREYKARREGRIWGHRFDGGGTLVGVPRPRRRDVAAPPVHPGGADNGAFRCTPTRAHQPRSRQHRRPPRGRTRKFIAGTNLLMMAGAGPAVAQATDADRHQRGEVMIRTLNAGAAQMVTELAEDAGKRWTPPAASVGEFGGSRAVHNTQATDGTQDHEQEYIKGAPKAIVRRNTEEVQGKGNFDGLRGVLRRRLRRPYAAAQHEANEPAGGQVTDIEIGDFLTSGGHGPQHAELLRLIGTLVGLRSDA